MQKVIASAPWLAFLILFFALPPASAAELSFTEQLRERIETALAGTRLTVNNKPLHAQQSLIKQYTHLLFNPVWSQGDQLKIQAQQLIDILTRADEQGLNPDNYHVEAIDEQMGLLKTPLEPAVQIQKLVDIDLLLSDAFLTYSTHLLQGQINPETLNSKWEVGRQTVEVICTLENAVAQGCLEHSLNKLIPKHPGYQLLLKALADYRHIKTHGGWNRISAGKKLLEGDISQRVAQLRKRLAATGDLGSEYDTGSEIFDQPLDRSVRLFQRRHGLAVDGVVGPATLRTLNIPVEARLDQLIANLERWRWLPANLGARYIMVNIAGFELFYVSDNRVVLKMPVVVGKTYRKTPVFSGKMTYLVINPSWNVPTSIAVKDKLPLIRRNPLYLLSHNMRLYQGWGAEAQEINPLSVDWERLSARHFPYHIVQDPGPQNALGKIKFMFPNKHNVYLHDTSEPWLFNKTERSFSSGCIRVGKPYALADLVLENNTRLTRDAITAIFNQPEERTISLKNPIPVHVLYWTAWVDESGMINFRRDIYGRDRELIHALRKMPSSPVYQ
ncbi:MAG: L,D-transpeptidase family protein [Gammaproteobacteria bacterium]